MIVVLESLGILSKCFKREPGRDITKRMAVVLFMTCKHLYSVGYSSVRLYETVALFPW
jgi:hypothetical protein